MAGGLMGAAVSALAIDSADGLQAFTIDDEWSCGHSIKGVWCTVGEKGGSIVIVEVDGKRLDKAIVVPGPPRSIPVRASYADLADDGLVELPQSHAFTIIPDPDGPVMITFVKYGIDLATDRALITAVIATRTPRHGPTVSPRSRDTCRRILGGDKWQHNSLLEPLFSDPLIRSVTFDLCGSDLPGLVAHPHPEQLIPLWRTDDASQITPIAQPFIYDHGSLQRAIAAQRAPTQQIGNHYASRGGLLLFIDDKARLAHNRAFSCTPLNVDRARWTIFDAALERDLRRGVDTSTVPRRAWNAMRPAIENFQRCLACPVAPPPPTNDPRLLLLTCGLPGSGKSYFAEALVAAAPQRFARINQDLLGSRKRCLDVARRALGAGKSVVVDRTNITQSHRLFFIKLATEMAVGAVSAIMFDVRPELCAQRILNRADHPTLPANTDSIAILERFMHELERPAVEEGLHQVICIDDPGKINALVDAVVATHPPNTINWPSS